MAIRNAVLGMTLVSSLALAVGCADTEHSAGTGSPTVEPSESSPTVAEPGKVESKIAQLGLYSGHVDGKTGKVTLTRKDAAAPSLATGPGAVPQAFAQVTDSTFPITTLEADVAGQPVGGVTCAANRFCAIVEVDNTGTKNYNDVFIEITSITAGYEGANSQDLTDTFQGFPLDNSKGLWAYSNLPAGSSNTVRWEFNAPDTNDFDFEASVFASKIPLSYHVLGANDNTPGDFVDACALAGETTILVSNTTGDAEAIPVPFPFNIYDTEFTPAIGNFGVSAWGTLGFSAPSSGPSDLPASTDDVGYTVMAFWSHLNTTASGVCYVTTGTPGSRKLYVTWKHANFGGTEDITFTAEVDEGTDAVNVVFSNWGKTLGSCKSSVATQGANTAVIGIEGDGSAVGTGYYELGTLAAKKLTAYGAFATCPAEPFKVSMVPTF